MLTFMEYRIPLFECLITFNRTKIFIICIHIDNCDWQIHSTSKRNGKISLKIRKKNDLWKCSRENNHMNTWQIQFLHVQHIWKMLYFFPFILYLSITWIQSSHHVDDRLTSHRTDFSHKRFSCDQHPKNK